MALPQLTTPEFETTIPSSKEPIKFRPFLVKEEKILYMALESSDHKEIFNSIMNILKSCILTPGIDFNSFTSYDLEYLFMKLRAKSVGEKIDISLRHVNEDFKSKCKDITEVQIDIDAIQVVFPEGHENKIQITDTIGMKLNDPKASSFSAVDSTNDVERVIDLICDCVDVVYDADNVYDEFTKDELKEFLDGLTKEQFEQVINFFNTMPKLSHDITFKCEHCGEEETVTLEGMQSFFT